MTPVRFIAAVTALVLVVAGGAANCVADDNVPIPTSAEAVTVATQANASSVRFAPIRDARDNPDIAILKDGVHAQSGAGLLNYISKAFRVGLSRAGFNVVESASGPSNVAPAAGPETVLVTLKWTDARELASRVKGSLEISVKVFDPAGSIVYEESSMGRGEDSSGSSDILAAIGVALAGAADQAVSTALSDPNFAKSAVPNQVAVRGGIGEQVASAPAVVSQPPAAPSESNSSAVETNSRAQRSQGEAERLQAASDAESSAGNDSNAASGESKEQGRPADDTQSGAQSRNDSNQAQEQGSSDEASGDSRAHTRVASENSRHKTTKKRPMSQVGAGADTSQQANLPTQSVAESPPGQTDQPENQTNRSAEWPSAKQASQEDANYTGWPHVASAGGAAAGGRGTGAPATRAPVQPSSNQSNNDLLQSPTGQAGSGQRRIALVIGNSNYKQPNLFLPNPANDAKLMAETLRGLGFELVGGKALTDLDKAAFERAVHDFGNELESAPTTIAFFYYAGHGEQGQSTNYLFPIDADPKKESDVDYELVDVYEPLHQLELGGAKLNVVALDACHNNPYHIGRELTRGRPPGGLAEMQIPLHTIISYAASPGETAKDGDGTQHSPYTEALAEELRKPGIDALKAFNEASEIVLERTGNEQLPYIGEVAITGDFYFAGPPTGAAPVPNQSVAAFSPPMPSIPAHKEEPARADLANTEPIKVAPPVAESPNKVIPSTEPAKATRASREQASLGSSASSPAGELAPAPKMKPDAKRPARHAGQKVANLDLNQQRKPKGRYSFEVDKDLTQVQATAMAVRAGSLGYEARVESAEDEDGEKVYYIKVSGYRTQEEADDAAESFHEQYEERFGNQPLP